MKYTTTFPFLILIFTYGSLQDKLQYRVRVSGECGDVESINQTTNEPVSTKWGNCSSHINFDNCDSGPIKMACSSLDSPSFRTSLTNASALSSYFSNLNPNDTKRMEGLRKLLLQTFWKMTTAENDIVSEDVCYTNCSITVVDSCSASVLQVRHVLYDGRLESPTACQVPDCHSSIKINCCPDELSPSCFAESIDGQFSGATNNPATTDIDNGGVELELIPPAPLSSQGSAGLVVGAVGAFLLMVVAAVLSIALLICCIKRRKIVKTSDTMKAEANEQTKVYKPKREVSYAKSHISQDSISIACDNSVDTTITHLPPGNYEQVVYTDPEPYSQWKLKFSKVLINADRLEFEDIIGEGEFSLVCRANYSSVVTDSPMKVAIKKLKDVSDNYQIEKFISESEIMLHLDHPNILNLMGMCFSMEDNLPAIVLPYMENGDLRKFLLTKRGQMRDSEEQFPKGLSQNILLNMCMDIARGMHYLSQCKLVHRDLAARNCMVDDDIRVKIADFGLSRDIQHTNYYKLTHQQRLPVKWMAPESLFKNIFSEKSDVWSYGIVCWEIFKLGKKPYSGIENQELPDYISHGYRPKKPSRCPSSMYEIMRDTWSDEPEDRPTFRTIAKSLANVLMYKGNIEEELNRETAECKTHHSYHTVDFSSISQNREQRQASLQQDEPVYSTCSQEEGTSQFPIEYEVPVPSSQTSGVSTIPLDYEVPQLKHKARPKNVSRPSSVEPRSHSRPSSPFVNGHTTRPPSSRPPSRPPSRSPSHHSMKSIKIPLSDGIPIQDARRRSSYDSEKVVPPYSKLNYKRASIASNSSNRVVQVMPTAEKPYSTLEWNSSQPTPPSSMPANHLYHTLEYSLSDQLS